jgi:hypothetical protein
MLYPLSADMSKFTSVFDEQAEQELAEKKQIYEAMNQELHEELPALHSQLVLFE